MTCFPPHFIVVLSLPACRVTGKEPATASSVWLRGAWLEDRGTTGWVFLVSRSGLSLAFTRALCRGPVNPRALNGTWCSFLRLPGEVGTYPIRDAWQSGGGVAGGVGRLALSVSQLCTAIFLFKRTK